MTNVSNNYKIINNKPEIPIKEIDGKEIYIYQKYKLINGNFDLSNETNYQGILGEKNAYSIGLPIALDSYNRSINNIPQSQIKGTQNIITNADDILNLYDSVNDSILKKPMYYGEYLSNSRTINNSLTTNNNLVVYQDPGIIEEVKKTFIKLQPAKVVVIYDLAGNIVNPGIQLSENEELLTTNDAIYDSEQNVLDNLFRTKIVRNDPVWTFYKEKDNTYTLLKNTTDLIYTVNWELNQYHFPSFSSAIRYIYKIIENKAIKVVM